MIMPFYHYVVVVLVSVFTTLAVMGVWYGTDALIKRHARKRREREIGTAAGAPARFIRRETAAREVRARKPKGTSTVRTAHMSQSRQAWDGEE
jgi:hypothetical protein